MGISQKTLADAIHVPYQHVGGLLVEFATSLGFVPLNASRSGRDKNDTALGIVNHKYNR